MRRSSTEKHDIAVDEDWREHIDVGGVRAPAIRVIGQIDVARLHLGDVLLVKDRLERRLHAALMMRDVLAHRDEIAAAVQKRDREVP